METLTIVGQTYQVPVRYEEGHELTAGEASQLNQVLYENVRNNLAKRGKDGTLSQQAVDDYIGTYQMGVRTSSPGSGRTSDPILSEFMKLAKTKIKDQLKKLNKKATNEAITNAAKALYGTPKGEPILDLARQRVAEAQSIASDSLDDIIAEMPEAPAKAEASAQAA